MNPFEQVLNRTIKYTKKLQEDREDESLILDVPYSESSPIKLFNHSMSTMIHFSKINFENFNTSKVQPLNFKENIPLTPQLHSYLDEMLHEFSASIQRIEESGKFDKLSDFISLNVMHTVTHIGQALKLQKINVNKLNHRKNK